MFDPPKWAAPFLAAIFNGEGFSKRGCPFETASLKLWRVSGSNRRPSRNSAGRS